MGGGTGTVAQPTIDYGEFKRLLIDYYKLKNPSKSGIPLQLEDYFLMESKLLN